MGQTKVECIECEKRYFVEDSLLPEDIKQDEGFPCRCPFCGDGGYAVLAIDN